VTFEEFIAAVLPSPHTITIEEYGGAGGFGDVWGDPVDVEGCYVEHKSRNVRTSGGSTTVSRTTAYAPVGTACPPRSRVTLPDGTVTIAIVTTTHDAAGTDLPEHVEINCE
jgi:hypothetical protein